jgi:hypothetical protein
MSYIPAATRYRKASTANNNATLIHAGPTYVYGLTVHNVNAAVRYLKLYDKVSAPTVGTDTPAFTIPIPASGGAVHWYPSVPVEFALGLGIGIVTGGADSDNTSTAANEQFVTIIYR